MKNGMKLLAAALIAVIGLAFAVIACDNGGGTETPKTFTVTFNADNGSENVTQSVIEGNKATKPENPTKEGNHFDYWFNTANNTEWDFDTFITADLILKAKWIILCTCDPKEHYLPCDCGGTGCTCDVVARGYIAEYQTNVQIPIYQKAGVTDEQAITATSEIIAGWNILDNGDRSPLKGKLKEVWIVKTAGPTDEYYDYEYEVDGNKVIIKIQYDNEYIGDAFYNFVTEGLKTLGWTPRGYISEYQTNVQIPIWQKIADNTAAVTATENIIYEWDNYIQDIDKNALKGKIKEVWIIQTAVDQTNKYDYEIVENKAILKIQYNLEEWYFSECFWHFATQVLPSLGWTPRGYIAEYQTNAQIPIWQKAGVTDEQAVTAKSNIIAGWNILDNGDRSPLKGKIKEVWIIKEAIDDYWFYDYEVVGNQLIIKIQHDCEWPAAVFNDALSKSGL